MAKDCRRTQLLNRRNVDDTQRSSSEICRSQLFVTTHDEIAVIVGITAETSFSSPRVEEIISDIADFMPLSSTVLK